MLRLDVNGDDFADRTSTRNYAIPRGGAGKPPKNPFAADAGSQTNPAGADEIWAYGLRTPGEIPSTARPATSGSATSARTPTRRSTSSRHLRRRQNYGWRFKEGTHFTNYSDLPTQVPPGMIDPIHQHPHSIGNSITGGYVYRGSENPALEGTYIYADYGSGRIF